eukprot:140883-Chlamydomonas_euryale.AAC.1
MPLHGSAGRLKIPRCPLSCTAFAFLQEKETFRRAEMTDAAQLRKVNVSDTMYNRVRPTHSFLAWTGGHVVGCTLPPLFGAAAGGHVVE